MSETRQLTITQIAAMFDLSRPTVRSRIHAAGLDCVRREGVKRFYDMRDVGPALFSFHSSARIHGVDHG